MLKASLAPPGPAVNPEIHTAGGISSQPFRRVQRLTPWEVLLFDLAQEARAAADLDGLLRCLLARASEALGSPDVALFVRDDEGGGYVCRMTASGPAAGSAPPTVGADAFVATRLRALHSPLEVGPADFEAWQRAFEGAPSDVREAREHERDALERVRARLVVPIRTREHLIGILTVGSRNGHGPLSPADRERLGGLASQLAFVIENARLAGRIVAEERRRRERDLAAELQQRLLPGEPPTIPSLERAGSCRPAPDVGGDYYDFLAFDDEGAGIAVADVAGRGLSAVLVMSRVQAALRSQAAARRRHAPCAGALADVAADLNALLCGSGDGGHYVTLFCARFDPRTRALAYVNGGHPPPVIAGARGGGLRTLTATGLPLGIVPGTGYQEATIALDPGDLLLAYTDGLTNARDADGESFGERRLQGLVKALTGLSADAVRQAVIESVRGWCGDAPPEDDRTFVVARVT